jgi:ABC-type branched-subunit amino acid transport system permease subunit
MFESARAQFVAGELVNFAILAIMALGLNVSFGLAGIIDFGFITYVALGAYIGGVTVLGPSKAGQELNYVLGFHLPWPIPLFLGGIAACGLGLVVGLIACRRLRSDYQGIVMIAFWSIAIDVVGNDTGLFNGNIGIFGVPQPFGSGVNPLEYVWVFLPIAMVVLGLVALVASNVERSAFRRALRAVRDDPDLASMSGQSVIKLRLKAMLVASCFGGIAGALLVEYLTAWNTSGWSIFEVVGILSAIIVGGRGRIAGVILGAFVVRLLFAGVTFLPVIAGRPDVTADARSILLGGLFLTVLLVRPQGILRERVGTRGPSKPGEPTGPEPRKWPATIAMARKK